MSSKIELTLKTYSYFQSESFSSKEIVRNSNVRNSLQPCPLEDVSFLQRAELYWQVNTTSFEGSSDTQLCARTLSSLRSSPKKISA